MAIPSDEKIEASLRRAVRRSLKTGVDSSTNAIRAEVEKELALEAGFLKGASWKPRSKAAITAAMEAGADASSEDAASTEDSSSSGGSSSSSSSSSDDTDSDSDDEPVATDPKSASSPKKPEGAAPKVNGVKRSQAVAIEGDQNGELNGNEPQQKRTKTVEPQTHNQHYSSSVPPKPFNPPSGYTPLDAAQLSSNAILSQNNLRGKEIWHITAPSAFPLSTLTDIAANAIKTGAPILKHAGVDYTIREETGGPAQAPPYILLPSAEGYVRAATSVQRTLRVQQKIDLPNLSAKQAGQASGSNAAADMGRAQISSVRPQPKGLRMHFRPPGFGAGELGYIGSGSESSDEDGESGARPGKGGSAVQFPSTLGAFGTAVVQDGDVEMIDATGRADASVAKGKKKKRKSNAAAETSVAGGAGAAAAPAGDGESPAEKQRRKEEKQARKDEKRARKEEKRKARATSSE